MQIKKYLEEEEELRQSQNGVLSALKPEEKTPEQLRAEYDEYVLKLTSQGYSTRQAKRLIAKAVRKERKGLR